MEKYGTTIGCEGCEAYLRGGGNRNHTEECRNRIENAISNDDIDNHRAEETTKRANEDMARRIEKANNRKLGDNVENSQKEAEERKLHDKRKR